MTVKEYLQQAYEINRKIRLDIQKLEAVRASLYGRTVHYDPGMPSAGTRRNSIEIAIARVLEYEEQIDSEIDELTMKQQEIEQTIDIISDYSVLHEILTRRYLLFHSWKQIAQEMNYSERHIRRLHGRALRKLSLNVRF